MKLTTFHEFNDSYHASLKTAIDETPDAESISAFTFIKDGDTLRVINGMNGTYNPRIWPLFAVSFFKTCVENMVDNRKPGVSLEDAKLHAYQNLLAACAKDGLDTEDEGDES